MREHWRREDIYLAAILFSDRFGTIRLISKSVPVRWT